MKISLNWIREFTNIKCTTDELVRKIGAQLGEVEEVIDLGERYKNIVIAKVISCEKHPNADKLSVCKIDDGKVTRGIKRDSNGYVQVVCGAPNVRKNLLVAWIPPKSIVPSSFENEKFVLEVREIRGVRSNGMLASASELAINDDHDGILVLDKKAKPGDLFANVYQLNDTIIDIENKMFTHRPDCFGILGVAREIAGIQNIAFKSPDWYLKELDEWELERGLLPLEVMNKSPKLVPRFMAVVMRDVVIAKSPIMVQSFLSRVGIKPINNIVDITNFTMVLTGQPMHAYDYDKVHALSKKTTTLIARNAKKGEEVKVLGGKTVTLEDNAIVIATDKTVIGIGGVVGAENTEVDNQTTSIILECANFDMYSIRRTSMKYGLFTDAVTRFNKGQSPLQNDNILAYAVTWIKKLAGGGIAGPLHDIRHMHQPENSASLYEPILVAGEFIEQKLGVMLGDAYIKKLLENVEFSITKKGRLMSVTAPFWRTDIAIPEDVVEEVGRLRGLDTLPMVLARRSSEPPSTNSAMALQSAIRTILSGAGANEVLTYTFVHGDLLSKVGQSEKAAYRLTNAISPDLQYYRLGITPSLLQKVKPNLRADYPRIHDEFAIYEINKISTKQATDVEGLPEESTHLALVFAASDKIAKQKYNGSAFFMARHYLAHLLSSLSKEMLDIMPLAEYAINKKLPQYMQPYDINRSGVLLVKNKAVGVVGEFQQTASRSLKLPDYCAGFEVEIDKLPSDSMQTYRALAKYPRVQQDITLRTKSSVPLIALEQAVWNALETNPKNKPSTHIEACNVMDIYQAEGAAGYKNVTFRLWLRNNERTLTTNESNSLLEKVASYARIQVGAQRV